MTSKIEKSVKNCGHIQAFPVSHFKDQPRNEAILILHCPECDADLCLTGTLVEHEPG